MPLTMISGRVSGKKNNLRKIVVQAALISILSACSDSGEGNPSETAPSETASKNVETVSNSAATAPPAATNSVVPEPKQPVADQPVPADKPYEFATPDADIIGLRLGMTPDQVTEIITGHNGALRMTHVEYPIYYQALDERRQASTFSSLIQGSISSGSQENIQVGFSAPPHEARAIGIRRNFRYEKPHILAEDYRASLIEKYGEPDQDLSGMGILHLVWHLSRGFTKCDMTLNWRTGGVDVSAITPRRTNPRWLESEKGCGAVLAYMVSVNPTTGLVGYSRAAAVDVKGRGKAKEDYQAYRDELSRKATEEKREQLKGATKPTL